MAPNQGTRLARGVVPHQPNDPVLKAPFAHGVIAFVTLRPDLDEAALRSWLQHVEGLVRTLRGASDSEGRRLATVAVGFSPSFFSHAGAARFPGVTAPAGFSALPPMPLGEQVGADVAFNVVATDESQIVKLLAGLTATPDVVALEVQHGYRSHPDREPFGYRDGVRNARDRRNEVVFVDRDRQPEEPAWTQGGTYLAFARITQNMDAFGQLGVADQDSAVGRDREGRRLDLESNVPPHAEGAFTSDTPAVASHVRKVGPRGAAEHDATTIFRRGMPFYEVNSSRVTQGLLFISFQASLDQFDAVYGRWMLNPDFPHQGAGRDALIERGLVTVERWAFFFVPPDSEAPIGMTMFTPEPKPRKVKTGRVAVRKTVIDASGSPTRGDLAGFTFQITSPNGTPVGSPFTTNSHGHALSDEIELGDYVLTELPAVPPQPRMQPFAAQPFTLKSANIVLRVSNQVTPGSTYG